MPVQYHACPSNYNDSLKGMEATAALEAIVNIRKIFKGKAHVNKIVYDDNSTKRSQLCHTSNNGKGISPDGTIETFPCDPSHRINARCTHMYNLAKAHNNASYCQKVDADRYRMYLGGQLNKICHLPFIEFKSAARAFLERMFNVHKWCDPSWY